MLTYTLESHHVTTPSNTYTPNMKTFSQKSAAHPILHHEHTGNTFLKIYRDVTDHFACGCRQLSLALPSHLKCWKKSFS